MNGLNSHDFLLDDVPNARSNPDQVMKRLDFFGWTPFVQGSFGLIEDRP